MISNSCADLTSLFFRDLKKYNSTNFRTIRVSELSDDPKLNKSFSSVVTRYFIFKERHPEISDTEMRMLYFKLRIDMIARYFSEYPSSSIEDLRPFKMELVRYSSKEGDSSDE